MPNGGGDNCGFCRFNPKARARKDPNADHRSLLLYCEIRDLAIERPLSTYCGNHPYRSPKGDRIPIGPVWAGDPRTIWRLSPDTEKIREHLLELAARIEERSAAYDYPAGPTLDETIVWQLGQFRERRAIPHLGRIAAFDPEATGGPLRFRERAILVELARAALAEIEGSDPPQARA